MQVYCYLPKCVKSLWNSNIRKSRAVEKRKSSFSFRLFWVWSHWIVGLQNIIWLNRFAVYSSRTVQLMNCRVALLEKCSNCLFQLWGALHFNTWLWGSLETQRKYSIYQMNNLLLHRVIPTLGWDLLIINKVYDIVFKITFYYES